MVGVAQASAATVKVSVKGSGTVKGIELYVEHSPPINCPSACESSVEEYASLAAIPKAGAKFTGWTITEGFAGLYCDGSAEEKEAAEDLSEEFPEYAGAEGECFVVEEGGKIAITANFSSETPNIELNIEGGSGTIVSNPAGLECSGSAPKTCKAKLTAGKVTLTASPAPGYLIKNWKKCEVVNGRQCTVTVDEEEPPTVVGITFVPVFELKGSKSGGLGIMGTAPGGINCGYACTSSTALYKEAALTVKAKPAKHFHFVEFKGGTGSAESCNGVTALECTIASFNSDSKIVEVYAEDAKHTLNLTKTGGGQGFVKTKPTNINCGLTCTKATAEFYASETPEVSVTLGKGTSKVTWSPPGAGTCTGHALTCSVPMSETQTLFATFE